MTENSPTVSFSGSDGQAFGNYSGGAPKFGPDSRPPFENPRPTFMTDNPQPQTFDRMDTNNFGHSESDSVRSPNLNASSTSVDCPPHGSSPSQFTVPQPDVHPPSGYFHPGGGVNPYDSGGMHQLGMRMDGSVPGTPIYEKSHMIYDPKAQQHQMIQHNGHPIQHSMISNGFVGDQSEGLSIGGGPQSSHHSQHQPWAPTQPSQSLVSTTQPFW